jgi:hypothetical protein
MASGNSKILLFFKVMIFLESASAFMFMGRCGEIRLDTQG